MENQTTFKTPSDTLMRMQVVHLGKILFNMQFIAVAIMAASVLSFIIPAIYYLLLISIAMLSLFTLFANPSFVSLWSGGEALSQIATVLVESWQYTVPIVAVLSIASIICLCFDKNKKHTARIVVSSILCALAVIVLLIKLVNSGVN